METTIAAIATPPGEGGISVIRVSGNDAIAICDRVFRGKHSLSDAKSHTLSYGSIVEGGRTIDEVLAAVMRGPRSYTGEDVVEISCHGGSYVTRSVLAAILANGAVLATPGEFTKRAFLNGRLDLSQAEAVIDLIESESETAANLSVNQLKGRLSEPIKKHRQAILELAAGLDAMADFPDEGIEETPEDEVRQTLLSLLASLMEMEGQAEQGRLIRSGINTVIVGKPNVGKSSLLNALSGTDRALVTRQAGTTRDVIEERVRLGDICLNLFDTAGIRAGAGQIEAMGIEKAKQYLEDADLVFFVVDSSCPLTEEDEAISELIRHKKTVIVLNKSDLKTEADVSALPAELPQVMLSAKEGEGIDRLSEAVENLFSLGTITRRQDAAVINLRHRQAIARACSSLEAALATLQAGMPLDLLSVDLRDALEALGAITGQSVSEEIVEEIFSRFCLGK